MLDALWYHKANMQHVYFVLLFLAALWKGAAPERILATTLAGAMALHLLAHLVLASAMLWRQADLVHLALDSMVFAVVIPVALRANRVYPLWLGAAQIIAMMAHAYRLSLTEINRFAYDMMSMIPSYIQLVALTLGLAWHAARRRRIGDYPSWSSAFAPPAQAGRLPQR
ncbi:hypothetical protein [Novosphingobium malaysiense]|uniref:Uncharacterized protein n=1 Tax=Novosphingobium malaysiense TaxID=1348853 RepID=A0A0B1ZRB5_9SPHN|nr:hypothetical protein [Novosphingobium malaysiense]KHK91737.1 hypothetical protein LK12_13265 [Novosphingobium malaysiense]